MVSIIMPTLNEEKYVSRAVKTLLPEDNVLACELLVVDGGSSDSTREIVQQLAARDSRIKLLDNPKRIQSAGVNEGVRQCDPRTRAVLRADCHAIYPPGFVEYCVRKLEEKQAASVVVPMTTQGTGCFQRAVAAAQNSILGNGGSAHRWKSEGAFVDHGHHAAFDRAFFTRLGGYDEGFSHNEDAEYDARVRVAGGQIWLEPEAAIVYFPRSSLVRLAKQYFMHGRGRAMTFFKHRPKLKLRQLLPVAVLFGCLGAAAMAAIVHPAFLVFPAAYAALCLGWAAALAASKRDFCLSAAGIATMTMHLAWAVGFTARSSLELFRRGARDDLGAGRTPTRSASQ